VDSKQAIAYLSLEGMLYQLKFLPLLNAKRLTIGLDCHLSIDLFTASLFYPIVNCIFKVRLQICQCRSLDWIDRIKIATDCVSAGNVTKIGQVPQKLAKSIDNLGATH
jgi:hypothetical protein